MKTQIKHPSIPELLRCEYLENPIGLDTQRPRFSWRMTTERRGEGQRAYRILVAADPAALEQDIGELWDSGCVTSSCSVNIPYQGKGLDSRMNCCWKVKIWNEKGEESSFSEVSTFKMGLLRPQDWHCRWIKSPDIRRGVAPMFRRTFTIPQEIRKARAYISGLGYYELSINGRKVGDHVLDPGWTDYDKRVLYETYDVSDCLVHGENALGIMLGVGWYQAPHQPQTMVQLEIDYMDGTSTCIISERSPDWQVTVQGPIIQNSIYGGELYDARQEKQGWDTAGYEGIHTEQDWRSPLLAEAPEGIVAAQAMEPIRVIQDMPAVKPANPAPSVYVYDLGQNIAGWARLKVEGPAGTRVVMKFAETIYEDGLINQENLRLQTVADTYILHGHGPEVYEPRFTYHGFRYIQVEGYPGVPDEDSITGRVVRSSVDQMGTFRCSNGLINQIQQNVLWTESGNLHSIPTDCPQRDERMGWLNDMTVRAEEAVYNYDMSRFYAKWENDIADTQGRQTGAITDTAPFARFANRPADPVSSTYLIIPWLLYLHYGDQSILERHYEGMKRWVEYLGMHADDDIVSYSYWGDWASPMSETVTDSVGAGAVSAKTPGILMSTGYYYYNACLLSKMAKIIGREQDALAFSQLADRIGESFNRRFFDNEYKHYAIGSQASNVFPLYLGIVPEEAVQEVVDNIVRDIKAHDWHLTTGNLCTKYIMEVLTEHGHIDAAYRLVTQTTYPSWGYMVSKGATTIWERWEYETGGAMNSHNHPMYGTISAWFYKYLGGIRVDEEGPGFGRVLIRPYPVADLELVECELETVRGKVVSNWEKKGKRLVMNVTIPWNCMARIGVPAENTDSAVILEGGTVLWESEQYKKGLEGITEGVREGDVVFFTAGSGSYQFTSME